MINKLYYIVLLLISSFCLIEGQNGEIAEKQIVIISVSRNDKLYYRGNLTSTINQNYNNYRIIWVDDASTDGTPELVEEFLKHNDPLKRVQLVKNKVRVGSMKNIYDSVHSCKDNELVVMVEGDDQLAHPNVLNIINKVYQNPNIWMSYGNYHSLYPCPGHFSKKISDDIIAKNAYRDSIWSSSHTRIYYAWLFKKIHYEDFLYKGEFYPYVSDLVAMFPMLEMAGTHSHFIPDILYVYNNGSPFNEFQVNLQGTIDCEQAIRAARRYRALQAN